MKKRMFLTVFLLLFFMLAFPIQAAAAEETAVNTSSIYEEQLDASGAQRLKDGLPKETQDLLEELGVTDFDYKKLMEVSPSSFFELFIKMLQGQMQSPLAAGCMILGAILLCSLLTGMRHGLEDSATTTVFSYITALFAGTVILMPVAGCIARTASMIVTSSNFMLAFIPIFTALAAASGNPVSAFSMHGLLMGLGQVISNFSSHFLMPLTGIFLAFSVVGAVNPALQLQSLTATIKKTVTLVLSFASTLFFALLSIRGNITSAADSVAMRGAKFAISSFIPIVGSALSDGLASIEGCAGLIKSAVGVFGIFALVLMFLPAVAELFLWIFTAQACIIASDLFGQNEISAMLKGILHTLTLLIAIVLLIAVLMVISLGILLKMRNG